MMQTFRRSRFFSRGSILAAAALGTGFAPLKIATGEIPLGEWIVAAPESVGMDGRLLEQARDYALTGGGSGCILRDGKLVFEWGDPRQKYDLKSTTKSIGMTALGLAIGDGYVKLGDHAVAHHPGLAVPPETNQATGWIDRITLQHLATQTAGFEKPGGYGKLLFEPGTQWHYSDAGPNWLAECITLKYGRDIDEVMFERVFEPLGITRDDLRWRDNQYRDHRIEGVPRREFGSGISANVNAMARIGLLYLREGRLGDMQIIPAEFVRQARAVVPDVVGLPEHSGAESQKGADDHGNASDHYGLLWWNNNDGTLTNIPREAFWSWGLYDSLIVIIPSLDIVVARAGKSWPRREGAAHYDVLRPFLDPIVAAAAGAGRRGGEAESSDGRVNGANRAPYPPSQVISGIEWAPKETIVRKAKGSDNWPLTWADDGDLYTAYGDGRGFEPGVEIKLSLGLAKISGGPGDFEGINLRSPDIEQMGAGAAGMKASGIVMVDGVLYLWVRNAGNSRLAWSVDRGASWDWAGWKFTESFACPSFLNFGKNYAGARDDFVYVYSHDADSAYEASDRMVLARVPKARVRSREAYEFFRRLDSAGDPVWTDRIEERGAVFEHRGRCYRSGMSYDAGLGRYLWCQILPESSDERGPRFQGGFGIYDAPHPWGPWTTVYFAETWDVGPGETSSLPPKWMSRDGKTVHLVFSGDDCLSVRRARLVTRKE